jgi:hypothetical protein
MMVSLKRVVQKRQKKGREGGKERKGGKEEENKMEHFCFPLLNTDHQLFGPTFPHKAGSCLLFRRKKNENSNPGSPLQSFKFQFICPGTRCTAQEGRTPCPPICSARTWEEHGVLEWTGALWGGSQLEEGKKKVVLCCLDFAAERGKQMGVVSLVWNLDLGENKQGACLWHRVLLQWKQLPKIKGGVGGEPRWDQVGG